MTASPRAGAPCVAVQPKRTDLAADDDVIDGTETQQAAHPLAGRKALAVRVGHQEDQLIYGEVLGGTFDDHEAALAAPPELVEVAPEQDADAETKDDDDVARDPVADAADVDLSGRAPARRYRFVLNIPEDGTLGAPMVEDISRSCPVDLIVG